MNTYNEAIGMYNSGILTSIFGAFAVTFVVLICWPRMVQGFGPIGGVLAAAFIIGTFWIVNHKLPGFGFSTCLFQDASGMNMQFGMIHQGNNGNSPWVDMGWAIGMGFVVLGILEGGKGERWSLVKEAFPRWLIVLAGGIVGGIIVGLTGYSNAAL